MQDKLFILRLIHFLTNSRILLFQAPSTWTFSVLRRQVTSDGIDELVGEEARLEDGVIYIMLSFSLQKLEITSMS